MDWIRVKEKLPKISYLESDNADDPYESYPVLLYSPEKCCCVGYLVKNQDEGRWDYGELSWEAYIPDVSAIHDLDFDTFTHWMPLPNRPDSN